MSGTKEIKTASAGFIFKSGDKLLLGHRVDKKGVPMKQLDALAGKTEGKETPEETGVNEAHEELGRGYEEKYKSNPSEFVPLLAADWLSRTKTLVSYQPFTNENIVTFLTSIIPEETLRLKEQDHVIRNWPAGETRDFSAVTGRSETTTALAMCGVFSVPGSEIIRLVEVFKAIPDSGNRINDAKAFSASAEAKFTAVSINADQEDFSGSLRPYVWILLENALEELKRAFSE